ncbi:MAG TPA: VOC family protein [Rhizomicrobium sp.]|nr:VOC family protein [Rhizomicrobium sp.]
MPADGYLDYLELPAPDMAATKRFYGEVFGWTFTDYGPDYVEFRCGDRTGGFHTERKVISGGGALVILYANDLDAMEAKVKAAGAEITEHHEFPGGRRFHFRDPNGNELAVWTKA